MISAQTAYDIAVTYQQIDNAEQLLKDVEDQIRRPIDPDREQIRDVFGRAQNGLQLGVPTGRNGHRLYGVSWHLAKPILEAQIATYRAELAALMVKARAELDNPISAAPDTSAT